jgi:excisionase family DNA binding protein
MSTSGPELHAVRQNRDGIRIHTKKEAAEILRVKVSWLERRAAARQIPFAMLGGAYRFTDAHLAEIVRLNEQGALTSPTTPAPSRRRARRRSPQPTAHADGFVPLRPRPTARKAS